jgi:hypothetical protein
MEGGYTGRVPLSVPSIRADEKLVEDKKDGTDVFPSEFLDVITLMIRQAKETGYDENDAQVREYIEAVQLSVQLDGAIASQMTSRAYTEMHKSVDALDDVSAHGKARLHSYLSLTECWMMEEAASSVASSAFTQTAPLVMHSIYTAPPPTIGEMAVAIKDAGMQAHYETVHGIFARWTAVKGGADLEGAWRSVRAHMVNNAPPFVSDFLVPPADMALWPAHGRAMALYSVYQKAQVAALEDTARRALCRRLRAMRLAQLVHAQGGKLLATMDEPLPQKQHVAEAVELEAYLAAPPSEAEAGMVREFFRVTCEKPDAACADYTEKMLATFAAMEGECGTSKVGATLVGYIRALSERRGEFSKLREEALAREYPSLAGKTARANVSLLDYLCSGVQVSGADTLEALLQPGVLEDMLGEKSQVGAPPGKKSFAAAMRGLVSAVISSRHGAVAPSIILTSLVFAMIGYFYAALFMGTPPAAELTLLPTTTFVGTDFWIPADYTGKCFLANLNTTTVVVDGAVVLSVNSAFSALLTTKTNLFQVCCDATPSSCQMTPVISYQSAASYAIAAAAVDLTRMPEWMSTLFRAKDGLAFWLAAAVSDMPKFRSDFLTLLVGDSSNAPMWQLISHFLYGEASDDKVINVGNLSNVMARGIAMLGMNATEHVYVQGERVSVKIKGPTFKFFAQSFFSAMDAISKFWDRLTNLQKFGATVAIGTVATFAGAVMLVKTALRAPGLVLEAATAAPSAVAAVATAAASAVPSATATVKSAPTWIVSMVTGYLSFLYRGSPVDTRLISREMGEDWYAYFEYACLVLFPTNSEPAYDDPNKKKLLRWERPSQLLVRLGVFISGVMMTVALNKAGVDGVGGVPFYGHVGIGPVQFARQYDDLLSACAMATFSLDPTSATPAVDAIVGLALARFGFFNVVLLRVIISAAKFSRECFSSALGLSLDPTFKHFAGSTSRSAAMAAVYGAAVSANFDRTQRPLNLERQVEMNRQTQGIISVLHGSTHEKPLNAAEMGDLTRRVVDYLKICRLGDATVNRKTRYGEFVLEALETIAPLINFASTWRVGMREYDRRHVWRAHLVDTMRAMDSVVSPFVAAALASSISRALRSNRQGVGCGALFRFYFDKNEHYRVVQAENHDAAATSDYAYSDLSDPANVRAVFEAVFGQPVAESLSVHDLIAVNEPWLASIKKDLRENFSKFAEIGEKNQALEVEWKEHNGSVDGKLAKLAKEHKIATYVSPVRLVSAGGLMQLSDISGLDETDKIELHAVLEQSVSALFMAQTYFYTSKTIVGKDAPYIRPLVTQAIVANEVAEKWHEYVAKVHLKDKGKFALPKKTAELVTFVHTYLTSAFCDYAFVTKPASSHKDLLENFTKRLDGLVFGVVNLPSFYQYEKSIIEDYIIVPGPLYIASP